MGKSAIWDYDKNVIAYFQVFGNVESIGCDIHATAHTLGYDSGARPPHPIVGGYFLNHSNIRMEQNVPSGGRPGMPG